MLRCAEMYELTGKERKEVQTEKVPAGNCITTSYFDPETSELLRKDVQIVVDPGLIGALTGGK